MSTGGGASVPKVKSRPAIPGGPYLVVGLARSGIAAAHALLAHGEQVIGVDAGTPVEADALREAGVEVHVGEADGAALLDGVRAVVKSPGVPAQAPVVAGARERGLPVLGELELAWRMLGNEFVAVTGTNGKTTTVELIGHIYREAGLPVAVAGNVGTAVSSLVGSLEPAATVVCEASSFQLEDTLSFAPDAAVLLNLSPDHLDRHGTFEAYREAKLQIFERQGEEDLAVIPTELQAQLRGSPASAAPAAPAARAVAATMLDRLHSEGLAGGKPEARGLAEAAGRLVTFGHSRAATLSERDGELWWEEQPLLGLDELALRGAHNGENAMAAAAVCLARGIDREAVRAGLRSFGGVPHRLEEIVRRDGVLYVNDSKATNVASTLVALAAFAGAPVHLILGGRGKGQDFAALREAVQSGCRAVYLIGEDAAVIAGALAGISTPLRECAELERALELARTDAAAGEVVLLSPACASFDQFADFEARGERFRMLLE